MQSYGPQPPAGHQAIGVLNIVFGAVGLILSALALLGSTMIAALGGALATQGETGPLGGLVAGGGAVLTVLSLASLAVAGLLVAGGIGILQMQPWGRKLSLAHAWAAVVINVVHLLIGGFSGALCQLVALIYPVVLLVLLNQPDWKAAFSDYQS